MAQP
ncbi:hypothetical protein ECEC1845_1430, partial [Escherichia coli EC1845]|jgi:hypothetical protein